MKIFDKLYEALNLLKNEMQLLPISECEKITAYAATWLTLLCSQKIFVQLPDIKEIRFSPRRFPDYFSPSTDNAAYHHHDNALS